MDHNPFLKSRDGTQGDGIGRSERVEAPGRSENIVWQTRPAPPTEYENRLGDALEACFEAGITELEPLVARLNDIGVPAPDGSPWTAASFEAEMKRLGG
ncbi:MAG: hypothetical protein GY791_05790 [Alphaproteobacteria bacterium]|nr:hypothetical protein [Alphaproteobacteria bacterium]